MKRLLQLAEAEDTSWKLPVALGMVAFSLIPVSLLTCIEYLDVKYSFWAVKHEVTPRISWTFQSIYFIGFALPLLTSGTATWLLIGKSVTRARLAWAAVVLTILHLFWFSYGILAFYLANQHFNMK